MIARLKKMFGAAKRVARDAVYLHYYYSQKIDSGTVLLESKHGASFADNIFYLTKELCENYPNLKIYLSVSKGAKPEVKALLARYGLERVHCITIDKPKYCKILASAKYLFNDTTFKGYFIKKEGQVYTNTWHGTPLKHMGDDDVAGKWDSGNVKRNFVCSDYLVYNSLEVQDKMMTAYGLTHLRKGEVLHCGYPRNAILLDREKEQQTRKELGLEDKKIVVYMPTWRDVSGSGDSGSEQGKCHISTMIESLKFLDAQLSDDEIFFVKMHVLAQEKIDFASFKHIKAFPADHETYEVLNTADVLITDYSSVLFDFVNTRKKIVLYTYDLEDYLQKRDIYYPLDHLPFTKVRTAPELLEQIRSPKGYDDADFIEKFCTFDSIDATKDLLGYVVGGILSEKIKSQYVADNAKPTTLMHVSSLPLNGLTISALSLIEIIDKGKENIFYCFRSTDMAKYPHRAERLPQGSAVFPIVGTLSLSAKELIAYALFYRFNNNSRFVQKYIQRLSEREALRFFGGASFDRVIHFTGYESWVTGVLQRMPAKKVIFVHSDMVSEIKTRGSQHYHTLRSAYNNYDKVAIVAPELIEPTSEISGRKNNIVLVENAHNSARVLEKSKEELCFDKETLSSVSKADLVKILEGASTKFINIGRFSPEKGHKRLVSAFDTFWKENSDSFLIIIGGRGDDYVELCEYVQQFDCKDRVVTIKHLSNPFPVLRRCDLFILSSHYEALGLVLLEATTLGIPCISTDIPGPREFLTQLNGTLVPDNEAGILEGMKDFAEGKIQPVTFDADAHNQKVKAQYEQLF